MNIAHDTSEEYDHEKAMLTREALGQALVAVKQLAEEDEEEEPERWDGLA